MTDQQSNAESSVATPRCPVCSAEPGIATAALASDQAPCPNTQCPVVTWHRDRAIPGDTPPGSYLPERVIEP